MSVGRRGRAGAWVAGLALAWLAAWPLVALAAHPFGVPEAGGAGGGGPGWLSGVFAQVAIWQSHFYRQLTGALRAWQAEGGAGWTLVGLSFAYGVFHALGPGHGKAVISAYVLANRQTARNGAVLAMISALIQALVAIAAVAVLAWLLNVTAATMNRATQWLETASFSLIVALGGWLVWRKAVRPLLAGRRWGHGEHGRHDASPDSFRHAQGHGGSRDHAHDGRVHGHAHDHAHGHAPGQARMHDRGHGHDRGLAHEDVRGHDHGPAHVPLVHAHDHAHVHVHDDDCGCGHAHVPDPRDVEGKPTLRRSLAALLAVGLRPCSGALIVLVFSLSQNFFGAGMASALAMGLGTGLTVAALVMLAVLARDTAGRFGSALSAAWAARLRYFIEAAAAFAVLALGALLLGGQLAAA
ncbi:nickel/cobalt transporter [Bordetella genomosp. 13]|uniref:nickel/cobalt transporter n=1 Tax=Bordetella genomosp. 13 TaxID=463040 RepID=UPI0011AA067C|nr:nickel/cobalt transporter [Bordetella genomosp. 13]